MFWQQNKSGFGSQLEENIECMNSGDTSRIPWIFCVFAEKNKSSKLVAAKALHEMLRILSFDDVIHIDRQMRQTTSMGWFINWRVLDINDFLEPQMDIAERRAVSIFASFNPNGFIREKAVHMMRDYEGTLPYIILRQNDWVEQVRKAASEALVYRLQHPSEGEVFAALPFVDKLKRSKRGSHDKSINLFYAALVASENEYDLQKGLASSNVRGRRICVEAILSISSPKIKEAFEHLSSEPDPFLRAMIFRKLSNHGKRMDEVIEVFLEDKYPMNRMLAFQYLLDVNADSVPEVAEKFLLDKNAMVRKAAQNVIQEQSPEFDFRVFYLGNLKKYTVASICSLGERGLPDDTARILEFLGDDRVGVVKAAMNSLMRLNSEKYSAIITEMLDDSRAGIVTNARNLILKNSQPNYQRVKEIFDETMLEDTRLKCMDILFTASKWSSIIYILETMLCDDEVIRRKALEAVERWLLRFNRSFALPSEAQVIDIRKLIQELSEILPPRIKGGLLFCCPKCGRG